MQQAQQAGPAAGHRRMRHTQSSTRRQPPLAAPSQQARASLVPQFSVPWGPPFRQKLDLLGSRPPPPPRLPGVRAVRGLRAAPHTHERSRSLAARLAGAPGRAQAWRRTCSPLGRPYASRRPVRERSSLALQLAPTPAGRLPTRRVAAQKAMRPVQALNTCPEHTPRIPALNTNPGGGRAPALPPSPGPVRAGPRRASAGAAGAAGAAAGAPRRSAPCPGSTRTT